MRLYGPRRIQANWLGWQDSNLRMRESKSRALPLGDTPTLGRLADGEWLPCMPP